MSKYVYPAVFRAEDVGGYSVAFQDLPGCCTEGDSLEEAVEMAHDALGLYLCSLEDDKDLIPEPSAPERIATHPGQFVTLVDVDTLEYRQKYGSRSVKKTLSIPSWLNDMAEKQHINFSQTLQHALREELGLAKQP